MREVVREGILAGIVRILDDRGQTVGAGFIVTERLIVTCSHVLQPPDLQLAGGPTPSEATIVFQTARVTQKGFLEAQLWRPYEAGDVAFIRLDVPLPSGVRPLPLASAGGTSGHPCITFGFPHAMSIDGMWGHGTIGDVVPRENGKAILQLRGATEITSGFSGAPLVDLSTEQVVGMITAFPEPDEHGRLTETAFAIPTEALLAVCPVLPIEGVETKGMRDSWTSAAVTLPLRQPQPIDKRTPEVTVARGRRQISSAFATVGEEIEISLQVHNVGHSQATNLTFEEVLPDGLQLVRGRMSVGPETLEPYAPRIISYIIRAEREGEYSLPEAKIRYADQAGGTYETSIPAETIFVDLRYHSALVGRDEELARLKRWFAMARAGAGRVVLITGEAGVGKTRLAHELCLWALDQGAKIFRGKCLDRSMGPFHPFLRTREIIRERDDVREVPHDLWGRLYRTGPEPRMRVPAAIDLGEGIIGSERFSQADGIRTRIIDLASRESVVLFLEDLHEADTDTLVLLYDIVTSLRSVNLLILATYRIEEVDERLRDALARMRRESDVCHTLDLDRLGTESCERMIANILVAPVEASLVDRIYGDSQGNPFLLIEILEVLRQRQWIERIAETWRITVGLDKIDIPSVVYEVILKRLEKLSREHRDLLEFASVEGVIFTVDSVFVRGFQRVTGEDLNEWTLRRDLGWLERVHRIIHSHSARQNAFEFDHAKIREALYKGLKAADLALYHRTIAQCMEEEHVQGVADDQDLFEMADHFLKGEVWEKAARFLTKAGEKAGSMGAYAGANRYFDLATLALNNARLPRDTELALRIDLAIAVANLEPFRGGWQRHVETLERYLGRARSLQDKTPYIRLLLQLAELYQYTRQHNQSRVSAEEARVLAVEIGAERERALASSKLAWLQENAGDYDAALRGYTETLQIARDLGDSHFEVGALRNLADVEAKMGNHIRSLDLRREALAISRDKHYRHEEAILLRFIGETYQAMEDWRVSLEWLNQSLGVRREIGDPLGEAFTLETSGEVLFQLGQTKEAIGSYERARELIRQVGHLGAECAYLLWFADLYRKLDDRVKELELIDAALELAPRLPEDRIPECAALRARGRLEVDRNPDLASEYYAKALKLAQEHGLRNEEARTLAAIGRLFSLRQQHTEAEERLHESIEVSLQAGNRRGAAGFGDELGDMLAEQSKFEQAEATYQRSLGQRRDGHDLIGETTTLRRIGKLQLRRKDYDSAIRTYQEALILSRRLGYRGGEVYSLEGIANASFEQKDYAHAAEGYDECVRIRAETGDLRSEAYYRRLAAAAYENLRDYASALRHLEASLALERSSGRRRSQLITARRAGRMHRLLHDREKARMAYEEALGIAEELGDLFELAEVLTGLGLTWADAGEIAQAAQYFQRALDVDRSRAASPEDLLHRQALLAKVYLEGNVPSSALPLLQEALNLARQARIGHLEVSILMLLSRAYQATKDFSEARRTAETARDLYRSNGNGQGESRALLEVATTRRMAGEYPQALAAANEALTISKKTGDHKTESIAMSNLAYTHEAVGELVLALDFHEQALRSDRADGDKNGEAIDLENIARVYQAMGRKDDALRFRNDALRMRIDVKDLPGQARNLRAIAQQLRDREQWDEAVRYYQRAAAIYAEAGDISGEANAELGQAFCFLELHRREDSQAALQQSMRRFEQLEDLAGRAMCLLAFGRLRLEEDFGAAVAAVQDAANVSESAGEREIALTAYQELGRLYEERDIDAAIAAYRHASELAQQLNDASSESSLCSKLGRLLYKKRAYIESRLFYQQAIALDRAAGNAGFLAVDYIDLADLAVAEEDSQAAIDALGHALEFAEQAGNVRQQIRVSQRLGLIYGKLGDWSSAVKALETAANAAINKPELSDQFTYTLIFLSGARNQIGDLAGARADAERAVAAAQQAGVPEMTIRAALALGDLQVKSGELEAAEDRFTFALELGRNQKNSELESIISTRLGRLYRRMGQLDRARVFLEAATSIDRTLGNKQWLAQDLTLLGEIVTGTEPDRARALFDQAFGFFDELEDLDGKARVLDALAQFFQQRKQYPEARAASEQAVRLYETLRDNTAMSLSLSTLVDVCAAQGDRDEAMRHAQRMLELDQTLDKPTWEAGSCIKLSKILLEAARTEEALALMTRAYEIYIGLRNFSKASMVSQLIYRADQRWALNSAGKREEAGESAEAQTLLLLQAYLREENLEYEQLTADTLAITTRGQESEYITVYVCCRNEFVIVFTPLALPSPAAPGELYAHLLRQSMEMNLIKAALDASGTPILQVEWPIATLDHNKFFTAFAGLLKYADEYCPRLLSLIGGEERSNQDERYSHGSSNH